MKYEPLKNKKQKMKKDILTSKDHKDRNEFYKGFERGVDDSFNVFVSYVDLFKRYKNNVKLLTDEQKDVWLKFVQYCETQKDMNKSNYLSRYNSWLFDYIFCDVNETDANNFLNLL